jgi:hypothetical protein
VKAIAGTALDLKNFIGALALGYQMIKFIVNDLKQLPIDAEPIMQADFEVLCLSFTEPAQFLKNTSEDNSGISPLLSRNPCCICFAMTCVVPCIQAIAWTQDDRPF